MTEGKNESFSVNFLKGEELLQNKGIRYEVWEEYERSSKLLPKTGKKLFEPNSSWLQHKQVEKGLQHRKDLLLTERVERKSQLAVAEWLPKEKKARIMKKSGQEWTNFGTEVNFELYLMPEEALLLLEMNCVELTWEGVAISAQQAYSMLLDLNETGCTFEEYKVYSQFVRYGYRLQRCSNDKLSLKKRTNARELTQRKKIVISPLNDLRRNDIEITRKNGCSNLPTYSSVKRILEDRYNENDVFDSDIIEDTVKKVMENIICDLESIELIPTPVSTESSHLIKSNDHFESEEPGKMTSITPIDCKNQKGNKKNYSSKIEIISEETVLNSVKILKDTSKENSSIEISTSKRPLTRIKRNVKLLPKRISNVPILTIASESSPNMENTNKLKMDKTALLTSRDRLPSQEKRQEVIELSDDEVEEVRVPMTRSEILNQLPNIALQSLKISQRTLKRYIPRSIKLRTDVHHFERLKWLSVQGTDNCNILSGKIPDIRSNRNVNENYALPCINLNLTNNSFYGQVDTFQTNNYRTMQQTNQFSDFQYSQLYNRNTILQQNPHLYFQHNRKHLWFPNRHLHANNYSNTFVGLMGNIMKSYLVRNQFLPNYRPNLQSISSDISWQNSFMEKTYNTPCQPYESSNIKNYEERIPTFIKVEGPSTWRELREKWQDERTITIDDEDLQERETEKYNEIEQDNIKPLITIKRNTRLDDVNDKLKLIKICAEKSQRQKEIEYKISYNVYSNDTHYKKANPGSPICRLLVIREDEKHCLNVVEVRQLPIEKDTPLVIAHVSKTSISYIQLGSAIIPDLI